MTIYIALLLGCVGISLCGSWSLRLCGLVILSNFIANEAYVRLVADYTPWVWFLFTDTLALVVLTTRYAGQVGAVLAATYATQIIMHLGFGISSNGEPYTYWQSLTAMAWLQLLILFAGGMSHGCGRFVGRLRRRVPLDLAAHNPGLSARKGAE